MKKSILATVLFLLGFCTAYAQKPVEMADAMHANGKIYVVVAVLVTIFLGIVIYLILLDRKITDLEKKNKK